MKIIHPEVLPCCYGLQDYVQEAITFLREYEPPEGYFVGFSGGKDSITALELCRMAGVKHQAFYSCTRIDPPEMYSFIRRYYPSVIWLYPKKSFWALVQKWGPPMRTQRYCCNYLKKEPSRRIPLPVRIMGIRAEESIRRASKPRLGYVRNLRQLFVKPIFHWPEWAVWDFIEARRLPYPSLYDEGWSRIGCVVCPFIFGAGPGAQARIRRYQERWPGLWKCFKSASQKWFMERRKKSLDAKHETFEEFWDMYLHGEKSENK